ncbi:unnamed protein product [Hymenolepis diminuta]|uniref:glutathione transferase n=1 Tax=Hymenolepis diminuta TaxID=6216 RepID=A0A0R3SWJ8_HYMDI|nr:unnamed protein product [Hymenolepis diminuta]
MPRSQEALDMGKVELGEMCRLMLHYHGDKFEDRQYVCGPAPTFDRSEWTSKKDTLGLALPNLPYYIDGKFSLTQSSAILEYLADKHDMLPNSKERRAELRMVNNHIMDCRASFIMTCYNPEYETVVVSWKETLPDRLKSFESYLGDKRWLSGDNNLPNIKPYMESAEFKNRPCNNKQAKWGAVA